jgi:tRNA threonylcarbamoyladenosine modification (KEOPS) complex  Pcc1 subunit
MSEDSYEVDSKELSNVGVNADIQFKFDTNEALDIFFTSFTPEMASIPSKRTKFSLKKIQEPKPMAEFHIECDDLTAFRATINHFILFASLIEKTIKLIEKER